MGDDYARERVYKAISALAASPDPLRVRLTHAVLELVFLQPEHFSDPERRATFTAILERCSPIEHEVKGSVQATIETMSEDQAVAVAKQIVSLAAYYLLDLDQA